MAKRKNNWPIHVAHEAVLAPASMAVKVCRNGKIVTTMDGGSWERLIELAIRGAKEEAAHVDEHCHPDVQEGERAKLLALAEHYREVQGAAMHVHEYRNC